MTFRPNILVILTEDLSPHAGVYGDRLSPLKSVDAIAMDGLVFENAYCAAPVCAPSRFSLITGMEPASCSPANNHAADAFLPASLRLLTHPLKDLGYYCANFSKADYNFEANMPDLWHDFSLNAHWRNRSEDQPFFIFFNFTQTHESSLFRDEVTEVSPDQVEVPPYLPDTPEIRADFARYYTAMAKSEKQIAIVLSALEEDGLVDSTVILQISDHGGSTPRTKRFVYDSGNKVPLIIKIPEAMQGERIWREPERISTAVTLIDFAPTIIDIAGGDKPETMIGQSLLGLAGQDDDRMVFTGRDRMDENMDMIRTARTSQYTYIRNYFPNRPWLQQQAFAWQAKGYQSWETEYLAGRTNEIQSMYFGEKPSEEFYDNFADPHQIHNLIESSDLHERIQRHRDGLDARTLAIYDNGFIPEGSAMAGLVNSREPKLYPLQEVLSLANLAIKRDPRNVEMFVAGLGHENLVVRFWAAQGLLYLKGEAMSVGKHVLAGLTDSDPNVRIALAELTVILGHREEALEVYRALIDGDQPYQVIIRAAKSLVALDELPVELLPDIEKTYNRLQEDEKDNSGYFNAGRALMYLILRTKGEYRPDSKVFDNDLFLKRLERSNPGLIANMQHGRK